VEEAFDELRKHSGSQFDPGLVPLFIEEIEREDAGIAPSVELPRVALMTHESPVVEGAANGVAAARVA
jgi:HD-GYP domain-containing protein (c-di-GMP phosphodiesterase class II)